MFPASKAKGLSLLEVMVAASILATLAMGFLAASTHSLLSKDEAQEFMAASRASREKLEEISTVSLSELLNTYPVESAVYLRRAPFKVYLEYIPNRPDLGILRGLVDDYAGEVVIVNDETKLGSEYGGDLTPPAGPDGVQVVRTLTDLNADGDISDTELALRASGGAVRYIVGVVIRWRNKHGKERKLETWTVKSKY
jgi:prepilin-type N-terminal cleavage/methylation domain-containing protein